MTRPVDSLETAVTQGRQMIADALWGDSYQIRRDTASPDGYGGETVTPAVVESGWCKLTVVRRLAIEGPNQNTVQAHGIYTASLPIATTLRATDTLLVNNRVFRVTDVREPGVLGFSTKAQLEQVEGDV